MRKPICRAIHSFRDERLTSGVASEVCSISIGIGPIMLQISPMCDMNNAIASGERTMASAERKK